MTVVNGRKFIVYPNVFSPHYVLDSSFYAKHLPDQRGKNVLEIGSGIGLIAIIAALQGAKHVTAVDINSHAVRNTIENAIRHGVADIVETYQSDIFKNILKTKKFDTIIWNVPWGDFGRGERLNLVQRAFYDPGYHLLQRFIRGAPRFLSPKGRLLIGFSTSVGNLEILKEFLHEVGFTERVVAKGRFVSGHSAGAIRIEIFEAKFNK